MIGVDTNLLVRYLTQDDAAQAEAVEALIAQSTRTGHRLRIDDIVLCELVRVLRGAYRFNRGTIATALDKILHTTLFSFEDRDLLRHAVAQYRDGAGDFADYVIGERNARSGCEWTATFDRALADSRRFSLLRR